MIHIFVLLDHFKKAGDLFTFDSSLFHVHRVRFHTLESYLDEQVGRYKEPLKAIIFMDSSFFNKKHEKQIDRFFTDKCDFPKPPFIVFCAPEELSYTLEYKLIKRDFTYCLSVTETAAHTAVYMKNLGQFITIILELYTWRRRISNYIVDSFKISIDNELINQQKKEIEKLNKELLKLSKIDYLTSVLNRRAFFESMEKERKRVLRFLWRIEKEDKAVRKKEMRNSFTHEPAGTLQDHYCKFSLIILDIDNFKAVNDTKGHVVGDYVLKRIAETLLSKDLLRETDSTGRYGGEEFTILLADTNEKNAYIVAKRIHERITNLLFNDAEGSSFSITISMGISEFQATDENIEAIIKRADTALYYAKNHGKNQIILYNTIKKDET